MPAFAPKDCPYPACDRSRPFTWRSRGHYKRKCDGRTVPRVQCLRCNRRFSSQTDRVDRGLRRPDLVIPLFKLFVSKVTMRQMASLFCVNLKTIAHRKKLIGGQCLEVHQHVMTTTGVRLGLDAPYVFDELETFETSKIRQPLTMPVVVHGKTWFVIHAEVGTLPARRRQKDAAPREHQSNQAVWICLQKTLAITDEKCTPHFVSDRKHSYPKLLRKAFAQYAHLRVSSRQARTIHNPMFPINNLFGQMRDNMSCLVRPNWAHAKKREMLVQHLWIYVAYRNYVRTITRKCRSESSASALCIMPRPLEPQELLTIRGRIRLAA
ncbi:MAG: hypothetical protein RL277_1455 [Planctomycetota bacterium]|jgi:hypothetical protein